jgi:hypothetical protein
MFKSKTFSKHLPLTIEFPGYTAAFFYQASHLEPPWHYNYFLPHPLIDFIHKYQ